MTRLLLVILLVLISAGSAFSEDPVPLPLRDVGIDQKLNQQIPLDLTFRDETGKQVQLKDFFGKKPVILTLVYYECPMLCTLVLNGLLKALRVLSFDAGKEFTVLTVSFDPKEKPALAAAKKEGYLHDYTRPTAAEGWRFLTGDDESIRKLASAVGFRYTWDEKLQQYAHATAIMILTPEGKISKYFYGVDYSPKDLRLALVEASQNKVGTRVDQILLYCYHYDPLTGKYGWAALTVMKIAGAITVVALATFMIVMFRRDLRRQRITEKQEG